MRKINQTMRLSARRTLTLLIAFVFLPMNISHGANNFPDSERIFSALSACALNVNLTVDAAIQGSLRSLFKDAAAQGKFSVSTTTAFLQLFPEKDKLKAYRAYRYCMFTTLNISPASICGDTAPSPLTRVALARFTLGGNLVGQEDIFTALLESRLRLSRQYFLVSTENDQQVLARLADADPLMSIAMANDTAACADRAEEALIPSAAEVGGIVVVNVRVVDLSSSRVLRVAEAQGPFRSVTDLGDLLTSTWRAVEGGLAPESWIWRQGIGFRDKLRYFVSNARTALCTGDETFRLMEDHKSGNNFIDTCQSTWRRNEMEPVCIFTCTGGRVTDLSLYKRLEGASLSSARRSASEQRAFINMLKSHYRLTDTELARMNIKAIYPEEDLTDPATVFNSASRDIHACMPSWSVGQVQNGAMNGGDADQGAQHITFQTTTQRLILELDGWSDGQVRWNFVSAYLR
jgi:hypothetical protein